MIGNRFVEEQSDGKVQDISALQLVVNVPVVQALHTIEGAFSCFVTEV